MDRVMDRIGMVTNHAHMLQRAIGTKHDANMKTCTGRRTNNVRPNHHLAVTGAYA